ncbi:hypothetical protein N1030_11175 [Desulfovibrio mangrovi]|uniref:hypothetical protein n=1 Tax=Desulfovibrio mangrovi TaxID=2976983 RepID=UPI00224676AD|nr:hypothetical protein [Desulfovibrio mangrovi]UZP66183.1 hypothetical protein N1030_11175 [Desulfovibrio mangrovi]
MIEDFFHIHQAHNSEISSPHIWIKHQNYNSSNLLKITNSENKKEIFVFARKYDDNYSKLRDNHHCQETKCIYLSQHYRDKLGIDWRKDMSKSLKIELPSHILAKTIIYPFIASTDHPEAYARLSAQTAFISLFLGVISFILGIISLLIA